MDFSPLNLIFAVAVASATIFLGFLPTRNIRSDFFERQVLLAVFIWAFVGLASPPAIRHYHFIIAFLCFGSWWQFRRDRALSGKMWLSIASGLGISIGVMLILATTPGIYPPGLLQPNQSLLLASIYLGGAVIGLACVCYVLTQSVSTNSGITGEIVQRYVGLLGGLVVMRAVILVILFFLIPGHFSAKTIWHDSENPDHSTLWGTSIQPMLLYTEHGSISISNVHLLLFGLVLIILPILTFVAHRSTRSHSRIQAASTLIGICFVGILAEFLARLLVL